MGAAGCSWEETKSSHMEKLLGPRRVGDHNALHDAQFAPASLCLLRRATARRVVQWMAERTEPTGDTSAITIDELHADYGAWCVSRGLQTITIDAFANEFDRVREVPQLDGKIRKFGNRYYGIGLVDRKIARLTQRRA